ncbi:NINE protein [Lewinella sp. LCG006]|uniref:TPR end-of-group domain-containing protein n=1 Tax=Lewinella sp. LCG006 TaxID=3231911 RepID=UPI003461370F
MKNKTVAGILALVAGYMGLHRFYLGQVGLGIAYIVLLPIFLVNNFWVFLFIGVLDAIILFSMDQGAFDDKYNKHLERNQGSFKDRNDRRRENRNQRYEDRNSRRYEQVAPKRTATPKNNPHLKEGKAKFEDYDYEGAIIAFNNALKIDPKNIAAHFNLACAHSLMEHKDKAFYHLDRAVALGFDDTEVIKTRDHLAYLRIQPEFLPFEANGFRLAKQLNTPQENLLDKQAPPQQNSQGDLLDQLQKLAKLKEKGLLTEEEFQVQKEKLLR